MPSLLRLFGFSFAFTEKTFAKEKTNLFVLYVKKKKNREKAYAIIRYSFEFATLTKNRPKFVYTLDLHEKKYSTFHDIFLPYSLHDINRTIINNK